MIGAVTGIPTPAVPLRLSDRLSAWRHAFLTTNPPEQGVVDSVTRWLVVTRAGVLPMTLTSGLMAVLLAATAPVPVDWLNVTLAVIGLVLAHLANNLMNDLADTQVGTDTEKYPRALYAPHPILSGLVSKKQLVAGVLLCQVLDLAIMLTLVARRDWWIVAFALGGLFLSWAYTAPPLRLKRIGLGELDVLITWGPLMVGGTYYAGTGTLPWQVLAAATVYALLPTSVLMGKHIDKLEADSAKGIHTLPVILGRDKATFLTQELLVGFFVAVVCLVLVGTLGAWTLLVVLALPRLWQVLGVYSKPPPAEPPPRYPLWPLWYVSWSFLVTRRAGGLFVLGLLLDALYPIHLV